MELSGVTVLHWFLLLDSVSHLGEDSMAFRFHSTDSAAMASALSRNWLPQL